MKRTEINKVYTEKVAEMLAKGYTIYTDSMRGSQGEIAKIDFVKGEELVRVIMDSKMDYDTHLDIISVRVGIHTKGIVREGRTVWNNDMDYVWEEQFAKVAEDYIVTMHDAVEISKKRSMRYRSRGPKRELLDTKYYGIAAKWLRKQPRMKTVKVDEIFSVVRFNNRNGHVNYEVKARNNTFIMGLE